MALCLPKGVDVPCCCVWECCALCSRMLVGASLWAHRQAATRHQCPSLPTNEADEPRWERQRGSNAFDTSPPKTQTHRHTNNIEMREGAIRALTWRRPPQAPTPTKTHRDPLSQWLLCVCVFLRTVLVGCVCPGVTEPVREGPRPRLDPTPHHLLLQPHTHTHIGTQVRHHYLATSQDKALDCVSQ